MVSDVLLICLMNLHFIVHFTGDDTKLSIRNFFSICHLCLLEFILTRCVWKGDRVQGRQEMRHTESHIVLNII